ncbi:hypothetical protein COT62_01870 [Candidatus Roizmanbacteria bacterium CG09_land_8_20_14_0_10_41_9]|uniref:Glycosyltransferase RgtA/B/C/D-like domain-containing protein n=1 Tax=Candidatus Roizmanbacteria bacterium CG09_land_8_20_14_0_10_41_9 TaxID=1974850 RepID=A0A2H0WT02_9BACT|nr:MAG: hypothetical protein COT62_01870 [Candidatus Roizmanbacteria bacterium CG09_land_8_20_14_0_10_41_9]
MNLPFLSLYFILYTLCHLFISYIVPRFIPYLGFFPYKELLPDYHLPPWISAFANFDGIHYLLIVKNGYSQYEQAFFPFYPLMVKFFSFVLGNNYLVSALFVSNVCFFFGLVMFVKYLKLIIKDKAQIFYTVLFLLVFPSSFYFGAVYTEGLFFLLLVSSLYFLEKKQYKLAGLFAALCSFTRLIGVFLIIPFLIHVCSVIDSASAQPQYVLGHRVRLRPWLGPPALRHLLRLRHYNIHYIYTVLSPLLGLLVYSIYLWITTGDPLFFLTSQPVFGANRSSSIILLPQVIVRYIKIFITAAHDFRYYVAVSEFIVFSGVFLVLFYDLISILKPINPAKRGLGFTSRASRLGLNLFSFANLILPTLTGTFSSIPRYVLFSLSFFIVLASIKSKFIKIGVGIFFLFLQILMLGLFIQGYFVS